MIGSPFPASLYMTGFYCLRPAASHILFIMLLSLTFLLKGASIGSLAFSFKTGLLNQKVIVDFQDFGLVTEARPQTAGRAVAQFKTAWWGEPGTQGIVGTTRLVGILYIAEWGI